MTDIRLKQSGSPFEAVTLDFLLTPLGDLDTEHELATAVTVALCTDRRADDADTLPDPNSADRRGWWADADARQIWDGWPIGSRLWLLSRASITPSGAREGSTTARAEAYIREALEPFTDPQRRIASRVEVDVVRNGTERIDAQVTLYRGREQPVALVFEDLWRGIRVSLPYA
ncbi:phage GP46 family protein [Methylobacterium oryzisoli]|uniref:phage GP46 family protein n=1 Tax=Methylobacterium oryzisoli TaxID=3385502 RepID=UPI0038912ED2